MQVEFISGTTQHDPGDRVDLPEAVALRLIEREIARRIGPVAESPRVESMRRAPVENAATLRPPLTRKAG